MGKCTSAIVHWSIADERPPLETFKFFLYLREVLLSTKVCSFYSSLPTLGASPFEILPYVWCIFPVKRKDPNNRVLEHLFIKSDFN